MAKKLSQEELQALVASMANVLTSVENLLETRLMDSGDITVVKSKELRELSDAFWAWRRFAESGIPALWGLPAEVAAGPDDSDVPF